MAKKIVTLIGKTKHHLLCQVMNKDNGLEAKVKLLEMKVLLERQAFVADNNHFDMMIDIAEEEEYKIDIRKLSTRTIDHLNTRTANNNVRL
jgi:arginine utilization protein RocB